MDEAQAEADDLRAARLQSLVVALDKAKLFLRHQPREMRVRHSSLRTPVACCRLVLCGAWCRVAKNCLRIVIRCILVQHRMQRITHQCLFS